MKKKKLIDKEIIGKVILSKVLEMNVDKYLKYVDNFIEMTSDSIFYKFSYTDENFLTKKQKGISGIIVEEKDDFKFYAHKYLKLHFELLKEPKEKKLRYMMNWINTRNSLLKHIIDNLFIIQRDFLQTQDYKKLVPISQKEFIENYPFPYLDISRMSRLLKNTKISHNDKEYYLKDFFPNRKKINLNILEHIVKKKKCRMKDREIQEIMKSQNIELSVRTICNYRKTLQIPAFNKYYLSTLYDSCFSNFIVLNKKSLKQIPQKSGVYEISIGKNIEYKNYTSSIIYFGCSKNLRKRINNYIHGNIKNSIIRFYRKKYNLLIRYFTTENYIRIEKELLLDFKDKFGSLPIANKIPKKSPKE